jgi:hypothetical protein
VSDLIDIEVPPVMRRATLTLAVDLEAEQRLGATENSIVVRLDDSGASGLIDELDETTGRCVDNFRISCVRVASG